MQSQLQKIRQSIEDYQLLTVLGHGTYAKVILSRKKINNKIYAIKILKKKYVIQKDQICNIMTERNILSSLKHPFLIKLHSCFQDNRKLYFVLEFCAGGQLFGLLSFKHKLTQEQTKFYTVQLILALEELHKNNFIYRDLKPENVLLDKLGYLKLTDFGLSKLLVQNEQTLSICGTPEYLAPEIIKNNGYSKTVDWWCLGCIIYEMLTGFPPYHNTNRSFLFKSILKESVKLSQPISNQLQDLVTKLLIKEPSQRLGANGVEQIKNHQWFNKVNWSSISSKTIKAPFIPILASDLDTSNFDQQFTSCSINSYSESNQSTNEIMGKFDGFSFVE